MNKRMSKRQDKGKTVYPPSSKRAYKNLMRFQGYFLKDFEWSTSHPAIKISTHVQLWGKTAVEVLKWEEVKCL